VHVEQLVGIVLRCGCRLQEHFSAQDAAARHSSGRWDRKHALVLGIEQER
jgi:hypothetical protein